MAMQIELNPAEIKLGAYIGKHRNASNRSNGVVCQKFGRQSPEFVDINGAYGEIAACRLFNIYPDLSITPQVATYDGIVNGYKVDFKTTEHSGGRLAVKLRSKNISDVDLYCLITGNYEKSPIYHIRGWEWAKDLWSDSNIGRLPGQSTDSFIIAQNYLQPVEWLLNPYNGKGRRDHGPSPYPNSGADRT